MFVPPVLGEVPSYFDDYDPLESVVLSSPAGAVDDGHHRQASAQIISSSHIPDPYEADMTDAMDRAEGRTRWTDGDTFKEANPIRSLSDTWAAVNRYGRTGYTSKPYDTKHPG